MVRTDSVHLLVLVHQKKTALEFLIPKRFFMVAEAGFEPTTFGL